MRGAEPQTEFEKPRGVSSVEVRGGYAQAIVEGLGAPLPENRLRVLKAIAEAGVSIDFLKLAQDGFSFLIPAEKCGVVDSVLKGLGVSFDLRSPRSIVMVHAVNMRDEEGLIARIVSAAIRTGFTLEHLGDMHDRMLIVLESGEAEKLASGLKSELMGAVK